MPGLGLGRASVEVMGAKILKLGAVLEHVVDGREHCSGHGADRLLRAAAALEALKLCLEIAVLLAACRS
jgi:hypothetical protein